VLMGESIPKCKTAASRLSICQGICLLVSRRCSNIPEASGLRLAINSPQSEA